MAGSGPERIRADFSAQTSDLGQAVGLFVLKPRSYSQLGSGLSNQGAGRREFGLEE